ncbi:class I SAM-dependent methyltransferase [Chlorobaculum sp. MV4-Y]|jgi:SAM-dependent methyltransferase|uniref:class I SAM-dependent methyltransferase n=1 Tax=Chlorobaculum sp. MV4-Y TaxID=2976335 RepID=UPI0021B011EE|nr:class I SAM-dependent methyltransferase [Chlorobaculum sp. MV4-Y]UWX57483.1 class I SAM-dependent methyltransferase [Chlorobaculum sp. MV4-Y]
MSFYSKFSEYYERVFPFREEVWRFLKEYAGSAGNPLLDVGCGPGHYCGRFAADGFKPLGIDLDEAMITEAKQRYPEAAFRCLDMRRVDEIGTQFDCIWSIGNVMAHLPADELAPFISKIHKLLKPGGHWLMQVMNWDVLTGLTKYDFPVRTIEANGSKATFQRRYSSITPESLQFSFSLRNENTVLFEEAVTLYPVGVDRYRALHEEAGFQCKGIFSDFSGSPLKSVSGTGLVLVFKKG